MHFKKNPKPLNPIPLNPAWLQREDGRLRPEGPEALVPLAIAGPGPVAARVGSKPAFLWQRAFRSSVQLFSGFRWLRQFSGNAAFCSFSVRRQLGLSHPAPSEDFLFAGATWVMVDRYKRTIIFPLSAIGLF